MSARGRRRERAPTLVFLLVAGAACGGAAAGEPVAPPPAAGAGQGEETGPHRTGHAPPLRPPGWHGPAPRPGPPPPPPDPRLERARALFEEAVAAVEHEEWGTALEKFRTAYDLEPRPAILYNMAVCEEKLGDLARARVTYGRYLAEAADVPPELAAEVRRKIHELEEQLGIEPP